MMNLIKNVIPVFALLNLILGTPTAAQERADAERLAEMEEQIKAITREIERIQLGGEVVDADTSVAGLPYGASKVYRIRQGVALGGYGEMLYENYAKERENGTPSNAVDQFDALRGVLYVGYKFDDRLLLNTEIEIEHADEIFLEFAYIEYRFAKNMGLRGGLLLAPLGLVNELHEPTYFLGTERSLVEGSIIPTTWRENGVGLFGSVDRFEWRAYVMNSLDGSKFNAAGLRGGRQKGIKALAEDFGFAGRVDYTGAPGFLAGASAYYGQTGQNRRLDDAEVGGGVLIWDLHADYRLRGLILRALLAGATIDDVEELNELNGLEGSGGIGSGMMGWYVEAGYDVLRNTRSTHEMIPFVRYERMNTQSDVAEGFSENPANDRTLLALGMQWKPDPRVAWKGEYQIHSNEAETGVNQFNFQIAWIF